MTARTCGGAARGRSPAPAVALLALVGLAAARPSGAQATAAPPAAAQAAEGFEVRFELNDAQVKDRRLAGVSVRIARPGSAELVASGETGKDGRFATRLPAGSYEVGYRLDGYVPYTDEATEVRADGQLVTVSLSRMLEATEAAAREVRIILNWGSQPDQVRDADSHLACACGAAEPHVYYRSRSHQHQGHKVELDVDDTDWGGPETITLSDPAPGRYLYWVHDYSGPPAVLGASDLVVRVLVGSEQQGVFRVYKGLTRRAWRPFKAIDVGVGGLPVLVRFSEDEIAEGRDLEVPAELQPPDPPRADAPALSIACPLAAAMIVLALWLGRRRRRRAS